jgi:hypothetical protein
MHSSYNPLECRISEVRGLPPHDLLIWTTEIYFETSGNSCSSALLYKPFGVLSLQSERCSSMCPLVLKINDHERLWAHNLQKI